jgi:spermidine/putrescine transport system permease protein
MATAAETSQATLMRRRGRRGRRRSNPLDYSRKTWMRLTMGGAFFFLYFPIVSLIAFSFNDSKRNITWKGFTLRYYEKAYENAQLHEAFLNSMIVASISTTVSTILGAMLGLALYRFRFPAQGPYEGMVHLPIVIPEICLAVAMVAFFATVEIPLGLFTITVSHIAFSIPFVAVVVRARMAGFDRSLEEASYDLGASQWQTFWNVTFPYMKPGLVAGALLLLHLGAGFHHLPDQDLFHGAVLCHAGGERRLDGVDRGNLGADHHRTRHSIARKQGVIM